MIWLAVLFLVVGLAGGFMAGHSLKIHRAVAGDVKGLAANDTDWRMERVRVRSADDLLDVPTRLRRSRKNHV